MITKTQISKKIKRKTNPELVDTINLCKKNNQIILAKKILRPIRIQSKMNLSELSKIKEDKIIVCGKVLAQGEINSKKTIAALSFSSSAIEKLKKEKCEILTIKQLMEKSEKIEDYKII
jgi:large subunit ribosomal protein L18e